MRPARIPAILAAALALAACSGGNYAAQQGDEAPKGDVRGPGDRTSRGTGETGTIWDFLGGASGGGLQIGSPQEDGAVGSVNRHLWRASLETLAFLPIASTDPFTGVIATDWAAVPDAPAERYKVVVYVTDTALTPSALRVAVFRERQAQGGWVPADVAPDTPRRLEDAILVRARQLRIAEVAPPGQG